MSDEVQPGVRIDKALWNRFREDVERRHGSVRGHLRTELETAIREYLRVSDEATPTQLDARLQRIEAAVGASPTDGGTDTLPTAEDTHTREPSAETIDEKPPSNVATEKKVAWLAKCVREGVTGGGDFQEVGRSTLVETVKDEYGFRSDTAKRYVERLIDHFDLVDHPVADGVLVTPARREELIEQRKDDLRNDVDAETGDPDT